MLTEKPFLAGVDLHGNEIRIETRTDSISCKLHDLYALERLVTRIRRAVDYSVQCDQDGNRSIRSWPTGQSGGVDNE